MASERRDALRRSLGIGLLVLAVAAFLAASVNRSLSPYDEGLILVGAMRVGEGAVPYRDFYANYGPAQFYVLAGLFKLFGPSLLLERGWDLLVRTSTVPVAYALVRLAAPRWVALTAAALTAAWLGYLGSYGYPVFPCLLFSLAAALCLALARQSGEASARWLFASGVMAGTNALFRFDVGTYGLLVLGVALGAGFRGARSGRPITAGRAAVVFGAGVTLVCLPVAAALLVAGALPDLVFDNLTLTPTYARMRSLPFPGLSDLLVRPVEASVYAPLVIAAVVCALVLLEAADRRVEGDGPRPSRWLLLTVVSLTLAFYLKGVVRVSPLHMALSFVPALLLAGLSLPLFQGRLDLAAAAGNALVAVAAAAVLVPTAPVLAADYRSVAANLAWIADPATWTQRTASSTCRPDRHVARLRCFIIDPTWAALVAYVRDHTRPDQTIFSGLSRHDLVFVNDNLLYFAADRQPATRWSQMDPGLQTSATIQTDIIRDFEATHPALLILNGTWKDVREPNDSAVSSGIRLLDDYIAAHYDPVATFGAAVVYAPRSAE